MPGSTSIKGSILMAKNFHFFYCWCFTKVAFENYSLWKKFFISTANRHFINKPTFFYIWKICWKELKCFPFKKIGDISRLFPIYSSDRRSLNLPNYSLSLYTLMNFCQNPSGFSTEAIENALTIGWVISQFLYNLNCWRFISIDKWILIYFSPESNCPLHLNCFECYSTHIEWLKLN